MSFYKASRLHRIGITFCLVGALASAALGQSSSSPPTGAELPLTHEERQRAIAALSPEHLRWLQSVRGLISPPELDYFLRLEESFRRDTFMRVFWEPRDPDPRTSVNELKARWEEHKDAAGGVPYDDPRFLLLLFNGPPGGWSFPDGRPAAVCYSRSREMEIWFYGASERTAQRFPVILLRRGPEVPYEVYLPGQTLRATLRSGRLPSTNIHVLCAEEVLNYTVREISCIRSYDQVLREVLSPPFPSSEWLANLSASATDVPRGAETFDVSVDLGYPVRKQSRTAVQVMLGVAREAAPGQRFDGELFHNFKLTGEVIRDGSLFETFYYRFEGPTPESAATIPLGFTRYLRPGGASLRILLEDLYGGRFAQVVREIDIPRPEGLTPAPAASGALAVEAQDGPALRLDPPPGKVHVGQVRFRARAATDLEKVTFYLDDSPVLSKRRPPYSVEMDLGEAPEPHRVRVVGFVDDQEVASDQIWLNQGALRFRVLLVEPRPGGIYPGSLTARIQVDTPDGKPPERIELFLGDELMATITEPPLSRTLRLPGPEAAVVRAVAYLADGTSSEDAVVVNAAFTEAIEVQLVELPVLVTDAQGVPIGGLTEEQFSLFEDGALKRIDRFQPMRDGPLAAALLVDRSISMDPHLDQVGAAAQAFAAAALRSPEDRVAVLSFADQLVVDMGFTARSAEVERALAGLDAGGGTAFHDSLVQAFNTTDGIAGPLAMVLFTDGQDESSQLTFEQAVEASRRSSAVLYAIGLGEAFASKQDRKSLEQLAGETGGRAIFLTDLEDLSTVYLSILDELRAGYLLTFRPSPAAAEAELRQLEVKVDARGSRIKTRRGYYP
ncbi:MAG: VWA domain-containing protein [Acidobacteriota bacterium]